MSSRLSNRAAGLLAKRQWLCSDCLHVMEQPAKTCGGCGGGNVEYFQSKKELARWRELNLLEQAGQIENVSRQIKFSFKDAHGNALYTPKGHIMSHTVDFRYVRDGITVYEDTKGIDTDLAYLKRELLRYFHGVSVRVT